ncbi:putative ABC transporter [Aspergillus affinis]|uniref:putative ABC transporter n=1 Tax=Aspergillus affinis TaxID=1070780 RepID=UPI0022FE59EE|nr:P-loop containing nucleoside triphosphate hydrolase protein [Aspergillus affinis]KAI9043141.1 P-loop containing nucleoside triphosphate hydrolase protein [Aspergillus affinis]
MAIQTIMRPPLLRRRLPRLPFLFPTRLVSSSPPLIRIQNGTFYENYPTPDDTAKKQNPPLFPNFTFELPSEPTIGDNAKDNNVSQKWAVIGANGRAQLLDVLRGQYVCLPPAARSYPYLLTDEIAKKDPRLRSVRSAIQYIGFSGEGSGAIGGTRGAYLSARYESFREETDWTVQQYLKGQISLNPLEGEEDGTLQDQDLFEQVVVDLRLSPLLDMPVANLSNGQTRRARIAKALLSKPELLLLDDPFMGLDPPTVRSVSDLLQRFAAKSNPRLILALRPQDSVPDWITHVMILGNSNQVLFQGSRSDTKKLFDVWRTVHRGARPDESWTGEERQWYDQAKVAMKAGYLDRTLLWDLRITTPTSTAFSIPTLPGGEALIEMDGVRVQYGDKVVLGDWEQKVNNEPKDGLHWTVRRGQRWVVLGANGSGKTTLLSLITSDHPQTYALPIKLFGRSRLPEPGKPAISVFELQSRLGHSSPEIHAFFPRQLTVRQSIESAFAETFLSKPTLDYERDLDVSATLRFFKPELDPDAAVTMKQQPPKVPLEARSHFPKLKMGHVAQFSPAPDDWVVEYADSITFGQLNMAQQRLILFIRALVHRPDIVILDEAFSGMPATMRDKCIHFLEVGEASRAWSTSKRRASHSRTWLKGYNTTPSNARFLGLTDEQALIMITHNWEEIPDSVRYWMRLPAPAEKGEDAEKWEDPIDFRIGTIGREVSLGDPKYWDMAWLPRTDFEKTVHRKPRRYDLKPGEDGDERVYEWYRINPGIRESREDLKKADIQV